MCDTSIYAGPGNLTWENRKSIAFSCARGLQYLHERNPKIIHRDIKPSNILLDFDYVPKLADFGLSRVFPNDASYARSIVKGTHGYLDPEYRDTSVLTEKSDVYSFGVVLLELITGKRPNPWDREPVDIVRSILQNLPNFASDEPNEATSGGPSDSRCHDQTDNTSDIQIQVSTFEGPRGSPFDGSQDSDLRSYVDSKLGAIYDVDQMARMIICAALCVHPYRDFRLCMRQVVELLGGRNSLAVEDDIAYMIANARPRSEPESSSSNAYPDSLGLTELKRLATQVLLHKPKPSNGGGA